MNKENKAKHLDAKATAIGIKNEKAKQAASNKE